MVVTTDHLAAQAGITMLERGGNAVDGAIAAGAVLAVTYQNRNGLGGDLLAVVVPPDDEPVSLRATGFAGAGANPARARSEGLRRLPARGDVRAVTLPGCVDGWTALHDRFGRLPLAEVLAPAIRYARRGFPASPLLARDIRSIVDLPAAADYIKNGVLRPGDKVTRAGIARLLEIVASEGRSGFYEGEFGRELIEVGRGEFDESDLCRPVARFAPPLSIEAFGHRLLSVPPCSSGYVTLSSAWIASNFGVPENPTSAEWAHILIEASRQAAFDRLDVLYEGADGRALLDPDRLGRRLDAIDPNKTSALPDSYRAGGTIGLLAVDRDRLGVSLMQSNAWGFGSYVTLPSSGVFLQNRGLGFSLEPGHPNEYRPGAFPAHTLCPTAAVRVDGVLVGLLASAGGDSQPQILLQLLARWLLANESPADAMAAGRFALADVRNGGPFDTWEQRGEVKVLVEGQASDDWIEGLTARGHRVERHEAFGDGFGHAQLLTVNDEMLAGATDPRSGSGGTIGY